jgi:hypothetical protein
MPDSLNIALQNSTSSNTVFAYISGQALQNNSARFFVRADHEHTLYFPSLPPTNGSPLTDDCAIPLGAPGNTVTVKIPQMAGGRIYFSIDAPLAFFLNNSNGELGLVEPSVANPTDPNINVNWGFCELTLDKDQVFANISYVDFVSIPIALSLQTASGKVQHVLGMPVDGLDKICTKLREQAERDKKSWDKLVVSRNGKNLRALSPNLEEALFTGYYEQYTQRVFDKFASTNILVNTQAGAGTVSGGTVNGELVFSGNVFARPSTADIFSCNTGPFSIDKDTNDTRKAIIPRLAAAFNRSTLLGGSHHPSRLQTFYKTDPTNHYSRIVHEGNLDHKGYAFAYDDVAPADGIDQSGEVDAGDPVLLTVSVGGGHAHVNPSPVHDEL